MEQPNSIPLHTQREPNSIPLHTQREMIQHRMVADSKPYGAEPDNMKLDIIQQWVFYIGHIIHAIKNYLIY